MQSLSIENQVFRHSPFWKVFPDRVYVGFDVDQEGVESSFFNRLACLYYSLKFFSAEFFVSFLGLHQAISRIMDLPSIFCTVIMLTPSFVKVIWLGVMTTYCALESLTLATSICAINSRFFGSMCTSYSSTALNGERTCCWRASRKLIVAVVLSPPLCVYASRGTGLPPLNPTRISRPAASMS